MNGFLILFMVKLRIDTERCQGHGRCYDLAPGLFGEDGEGYGTVLGEIIEQYLTQTEQGRAELARVVNEGDMPALARTAHTLKGASATVGATALADLCADIETHSLQTQPPSASSVSATDLIERFDAEFARARDALAPLAART